MAVDVEYAEAVALLREEAGNCDGERSDCYFGTCPHRRMRALLARIELRTADYGDPELDHAVAEVKAAGG